MKWVQAVVLLSSYSLVLQYFFRMRSSGSFRWHLNYSFEEVIKEVHSSIGTELSDVTDIEASDVATRLSFSSIYIDTILCTCFVLHIHIRCQFHVHLSRYVYISTFRYVCVVFCIRFTWIWLLRILKLFVEPRIGELVCNCGCRKTRSQTLILEEWFQLGDATVVPVLRMCGQRRANSLTIHRLPNSPCALSPREITIRLLPRGTLRSFTFL